MTTYTTTIHPATRDDISAIDLSEEMGHLDRMAEPYECYTASAYDADTTERAQDHDLQIVWLPNVGRAGMCTNGTSDWADYDSLDAAVADYLNDWDAFEARN